MASYGRFQTEGGRAPRDYSYQFARCVVVAFCLLFAEGSLQHAGSVEMAQARADDSPSEPEKEARPGEKGVGSLCVLDGGAAAR